MSAELTLAQATIGIVTALPKELAAVRVVFSPSVSVAGPSGTVYDLCAVPCVGGQVVIAMTLFPGMGNNLAAAQTTRMLLDCKDIRDVMMVGIAGAIPCPADACKHVRLGDIVVSGPQGVFQFDLGKQVAEKPFEHRAVPTRPSALLLNAINRLMSLEEIGEHPWEQYIVRTSDLLPEWRRPDPVTDLLDDGKGVVPHPADSRRRQGAPRLFVGAIASSNIVLKDAARRDAIAAAVPDAGGVLCCVEMEGAGVQDATWVDNAGYLIVRGTCDYCNEKKNDLWQKHAALIAAAFARSIVEALPSPPPSSASVNTLTVFGSPQNNSFGIVQSNAPVTIVNISATQVSLQLGSQLAHQTVCVPVRPGRVLRAKHGGRVADTAKEVCLQALLWLRTFFLKFVSKQRREVPAELKQRVRRAASDIRDALSVWDFEKAGDIASVLDLLLVECEGAVQDDSMNDAVLFAARAHVNAAEVSNLAVGKHIKRAIVLLSQVEKGVWGNAQDCLAEVVALKASLASIEKGPEAGLAVLGARTDPYANRTRTALLLNQQKFAKAMAVVEGLEPHERWCDVAVKAYALNDQIEKAQALVRWAAGLPDRSRYPQCVVRLAEGLMARALAGHDKDINILPNAITPTERGKLSVVGETLQPVLLPIQVAGRPTSGLDMAALQIAWHANHLLQRRERVVELLGLMRQWTPVPIGVGQGVILGYTEAPPDLPDRLRKDHPGDLDAGMLAALIDMGSVDRYGEAFAKAKELLPLADSNEKKEELFKLFQQIWQHIEGPEVGECEAIVEPLITHNPRIQAVFAGSIALRRGDADRAIAILDGQKSEDDPYWLQIRANALLQKRQLAEAVDFLLVAAKLTRDTNLLHKTGDIAFQVGRHDVAVWCYEGLTEIQPDNLPVHGNLAHIYTFVLHDLEKAAIQFRALHRIEPANPTHTFNLAVCLAQVFQPEESLALFEELCRQESPAIPAVLGRAQLYHSLGRPDAALASLEPFRERFWQDPNFLMAYMTTAHAAGNDAAGHETLMALNQLRDQGTLKPEAFRLVHKDEVLELFKQSFKENQDRNEHLHVEMLKGRMPWVWAEQVSKNAIYWGWRTRTQEMGWIGDEPTNRARFCIYTTNGFHAREADRGQRALLPLECPPRGSKVVADISALITIHRLGLLDAAAEHFGEVLVPAGYLPTVLEDSRQMVLNQRSRQQSAEQIAKQVNAGCIGALAESTEPVVAMAIADEYAETAEHRYRLTDLIRPLHTAGILSEADFAPISRVYAKPSAVDAMHPALEQFREITVDLTTLETIAQFGLLDALTRFYRIRIAAQAHREVLQRLQAIACQEETRQWHMDLWNHIRGDARFRFVPHTVPKEMRQEKDDSRDYLPFLAGFIAQETKTPLMADDRVCQALTLNAVQSSAGIAFGTDVFVRALMTAGKLDPAKATATIHQLMGWRYRFIVPPPEVLKVMADQYRGNLPGHALQEVAEYVHDCMRDPGLFGGRENTALGDSMAMRFYLVWLSTIAEFLVLVWTDEGFTPEAATRLTEWSTRELLPSAPRVLDGQMKVRTSSMTCQLFLSHALLKTASHYGEPRMADAMKAMKEAMRLTDEEYTRIVTGFLNDTARTAPKS